MRVKFGATGTKDVPILEVTAENYIVPSGEENTYHCRIEQIQFSPTTGKRLSKPMIQKFEAKMFPSVQRNLRQQGWTIDVLYDPTDYLREQKEKEAMTREQRKAAEEARKQREREAMKNEIIAELKAAGMIAQPKKESKSAAPKTGGAKK